MDFLLYTVTHMGSCVCTKEYMSVYAHSFHLVRPFLTCEVYIEKKQTPYNRYKWCDGPKVVNTVEVHRAREVVQIGFIQNLCQNLGWVHMGCHRSP